MLALELKNFENRSLTFRGHNWFVHLSTFGLKLKPSAYLQFFRSIPKPLLFQDERLVEAGHHPIGHPPDLPLSSFHHPLPIPFPLRLVASERASEKKDSENKTKFFGQFRTKECYLEDLRFRLLYIRTYFSTHHPDRGTGRKRLSVWARFAKGQKEILDFPLVLPFDGGILFSWLHVAANVVGGGVTWWFEVGLRKDW